MNEDYRITVIMGIYNCADTLVEALESLESQTYKKFKVVLCDDGSKDDTFAVANKWAETHPNPSPFRGRKVALRPFTSIFVISREGPSSPLLGWIRSISPTERGRIV